MNITYEILLNCYRKFKSYVYYSNNLNFLYGKLASFEYNESFFETKLKKLLDALNNKNPNYFHNLIRRIRLVPQIKTIEDKKNESFLCNNKQPKPISVNIKSVNFFIDCPIELFIVDTLFSLLCFAATSDTDIFKHCFANIQSDDLIIKNNSKELLKKINFNSLSIFCRYFDKYREWQEDIIDQALELHKTNDIKIVSIDLKKYFYSVDFNFQDFKNFIYSCNSDFLNYDFLVDIIAGLYSFYPIMLSKYYNDNFSDRPLPIGLVSSGIMANFCLSEFDKKINNLKDKGVVCANRYVDDILILIKGHIDKDFSSLVGTVFKDLINKTSIKNEFELVGNQIKIQENKTRIFDICKHGNDILLSKLKKNIFLPSGTRLFPKYISNFNQLYGSVVGETDSLKMRENLNNTNINVNKFSSSLAGFLLMQQETVNNKSKKENAKQLHYLLDSKTILYTNTRWSKLFSFYIQADKNNFNKFSKFVSNTVNKCIYAGDDLTEYGKNSFYANLVRLYRISVAECLAPHSSNLVNKMKNKEIILFAKQLRAANLFDRYVVSYPLANYLKGCSNKGLCVFDYDLSKYSIDDRKLLLSPRFIHLDEFLYFCQCKRISENKSFTVPYHLVFKEYDTRIKKYFTFVKENLEIIKIKDKKFNIYNIKYKTKIKDFTVIPVAIANVDLSRHKLLNGSGYDATLLFSKGTINEKNTLINLLEQCYFENKGKKNNDNPDETNSAKFLVFPEYFLPLSWIDLLIRFSKKTSAVIVSGLRPIKIGSRVINLQAVIVPFENAFGYLESAVFLREKNFYAPLDKQVINNTGLNCFDSTKPTYFLFDNHHLKFSCLICYELTDVASRSIFKNNVNIVITSEYNEDVYYFSDIVQSSARDLSAFIVQVNSSNYGDSRIVAPYRDKYREILKITGGIKDITHIGIIDFLPYINYLKDFRACNKAHNYKSINVKYKKGSEKYKIFKKPSAGIK